MIEIIQHIFVFKKSHLENQVHGIMNHQIFLKKN